MCSIVSSRAYLDTTAQVLEKSGVLGAVVGGDVIEERMRSATETAKRPVDGTKKSC